MRKLLILAGLALAAPVAAQTDKMAPSGRGEATIYRDTGFQGSAVFIDRANPNLALSWPVRSIRVRSGQWQLCSRTNFRGRCATVSADEPDIRGRTGFFDQVQSMRPLGGPGPLPPTPGVPEGTSLRGMSAEFFPAPGERGLRIASCPTGGGTANCAKQTAERFCKSRGWNYARSATQETIGRVIYLADVLCSRSLV